MGRNAGRHAYRDSLGTVNEQIRNLHRQHARLLPHGDSSIYEALVVMSQDFKKGLPLIDGHGNFGNIEGDGCTGFKPSRTSGSALAMITLMA